MKKITILSLVFITLLTIQVQAQLSISPRLGYNIASFDTDNDGASVTSGFQIGATLDYALTDHFSVQPSLLLSRKGARFKSDVDPNNGVNDLEKVVVRVSYLEVPVLATVKGTLEGVKVYAGIGPYVGFAVGGKNDATFEDGTSVETDLEIGNTEDDPNTPFVNEADDIKGTDFGFRFAVGAEIYGFQVGVDYDLGLSDISNDNNSIKTRTFGITVGYFFEL